MKLTEIIAYIGAITGISSLAMHYIRFRREKPRLRIEINKNKRHGYSFRYPYVGRDEYGSPKPDKENPIHVAFMSIKLINESSFPISIHSVEGTNELGKCLFHSDFPTIHINEISSLGFSRSSYIQLPLNIKAFETEEAYVSFDIKVANQDMTNIKIIIRSSRGTFPQKVKVHKYIDQSDY